MYNNIDIEDNLYLFLDKIWHFTEDYAENHKFEKLQSTNESFFFAIETSMFSYSK